VSSKSRSFTDSRHRVTSTWLYQFWLFSFKTAKDWGRGPRNWTAGNLEFDSYQEIMKISSPNTPAMIMNSPAHHASPGGNAINNDAPLETFQNPTSLCRWSIHVRCIPYVRIPSPPPSLQDDPDPHYEQTWTAWPDLGCSPQIAEKLQEGLESNDFSNIKVNDLPISSTQIARAARRSPDELLKEAFGFSIMGRNVDLVSQLLDNIVTLELDFSGLYPFHLATSYLDGSKICCNILDSLVLDSDAKNSVRKLYVNDLGHTLLDNLMISILKAHTPCLPGIVDEAFKKEKHFAGEFVDICGRWDADSDYVRQLLANGLSAIPFEWKHMFCHTSVQTICHCIGSIFGPSWAPDINAPSGLFLRRCSPCGLKLQLLPLHTLVLIAFHLARSGCKGETLFGILACLLCLISNGVNPLLKVPVSLRALMGSEQADECSHEELDPAELAEKVPANVISTWPKQAMTGWQVFCHVIRDCQEEWKREPPRQRSASVDWEGRLGLEDPIFGGEDDEMNIDEGNVDDEMAVDDKSITDLLLPVYCDKSIEHKNFFGTNKNLAILWAAVQTELLTYRRLAEEDAWISENFDMDVLLENLKNRSEIDIRLVAKQMMKPFCGCGKFGDAADDVAVCVEEACAYYFSNLEDWGRTTFIESQSERREVWT
jgi:hypothetical protein